MSLPGEGGREDLRGDEGLGEGDTLEGPGEDGEGLWDVVSKGPAEGLTRELYTGLWEVSPFIWGEPLRRDSVFWDIASALGEVDRSGELYIGKEDLRY